MSARAAYEARTPGLARALGRGLTRRCGRCGSGKLFRRWFIMAKRCPRCGLKFERLEGYWLGSMALNLVVTEGMFVIGLVTLLTATWPDVPWTSVLISLVALNIAVPLLAHPFSRTVWIAGERHFSATWNEEDPTAR